LPASIASLWRKPVVREKTSTSKRGSSVTVTVPVIAPWNLQWNVYVPGAVNLCVTAVPPALRVSSMSQLPLVDVTECVVAAWSNSQVTVPPWGIVTTFGWNACAGESTALMVGGAWAAAVPASAPQSVAVTSTASSDLHREPI
jgi:hypothetical protein